MFEGGNVIIVLLTLFFWVVPLVALAWFVRTLSSIATAQREIALRLAGIEAELRAGTRPPVS